MSVEQVQGQEQGAPAEEAADFARVGAMVAEGEPAAPLEQVEQEQPKADAAESMAGLLTMLGAGASMAGFEHTAAVWSPQACGEVAAKAVPVLRKYPWGARILDFFETGAGAEEIALGVCVAPLAVATYKAIKADMSPKDETPAEPARASVPGPVEVGARPVVPVMKDVHEMGRA